MEETTKNDVPIERIIAEAELIRNREKKLSLEKILASIEKEV